MVLSSFTSNIFAIGTNSPVWKSDNIINMKPKKKKIKTQAELEAEVAAQQIQSKRYHEKVKESAKVYKRQDTKKQAEEQIASEK